jgi:type I restriction enzyme R subunit
VRNYDGKPMSSTEFVELLNGQLPEFAKNEAENSDLFEQEERAQQARLYVNARFTTKQQLFIDVVLPHDVTMGVQEEKPAPLLRLHDHNSIIDAVPCRYCLTRP